MKRDDTPDMQQNRPRKALESIAAEVPLELAGADALLTHYGRWAVSFSRGGKAHTVDRQFIPEQERTARYALDRRREEAYGRATRDVLMTTPIAQQVQGCIGRLPQMERCVLQALYVPRRIPATAQLQILGVSPQNSRVLHISGLKRFARFARELRLLDT
jgi:hypothetical protein